MGENLAADAQARETLRIRRHELTLAMIKAGAFRDRTPSPALRARLGLGDNPPPTSRGKQQIAAAHEKRKKKARF